MSAIEVSKAFRDDLSEGECQVLSVLVAHGGVAPQSAVVKSRPWSKATVSRYVHDLEDGDHVNILPIGRRNLLFLPGCDPDLAEFMDGGSA